MSAWVNSICKLHSPQRGRLQSWLTDPASTTSKFQALNLQTKLEVLEQKIPPASKNAVNHINLERHVQIHIDDSPFIIASSFIMSCDQQILKNIHSLGERPIGEVIFGHLQAKRLPFSFSQTPPSWQTRYLKPSDMHNTLSRFSCITVKRTRMYLFETFLTQHSLLTGNTHV